MGNCTVKGNTVGCFPQESTVVTPCPAGGKVRLATSSGEVLELEAPVEVGDVLKDFPGHGIFRRCAAVCPMFHGERLHGDMQYYLLPQETKRQEKPSFNPSLSRLEVLPSVIKGVWRVRLAIDAEVLAAVLAEEMNVDALVERMRLLASTAAQS